MNHLTSERFSEFFFAQYGYDPFPWQAQLAAQVVAGKWPKQLKLPTASGKTALLDIALYALAVQAHLPAAERNAPRRIAFVVDRRVIVDEAFARAQKIARRLQTDESPIVREVAEALRSLSGSSTPLKCYQLRGGMYRDDDWARTPTQPVILTSTVDQIGSRLLFRSYGAASPNTWPIHAGLTAFDTLIILDEAHCAEPFRQTAEAAQRYRQMSPVVLPGPFHFITMTATPKSGESTFELSANDRAHPVLQKRLTATKPALLCVAGDWKKAKEHSESQQRDALVDELVKQALRLVETPELKAIGVMVNRVATARAVYAALRGAGHTTLLLIGSMRPFDRDREQAKDTFTQLLADHSERRKLNEPVFVVATQTLEVGANLDFDALVSECASLDALRQRFGRLNRMGRRDIPAQGAIVIRADQIRPAKDKDDPVYGAALPKTWEWLTKTLPPIVEAEPVKGKRVKKMKPELNTTWRVDFGVAALEPEIAKLDADELKALQLALPDAPTMLPAHLDAWAQTQPAPLPEPDPAIFLHGPQRGQAEVKLVWRADVATGMNETQWVETVALCPPTAAEALTAPLYRVKQWLADACGLHEDMQADIEGQAEPNERERNLTALASECTGLVWRGPDESALLNAPRDLHPNDTLILSVGSGGWEVFGHVPDDSPIDVAEAALFAARRELRLRLYPDLLKQWPDSPAKRQLLALVNIEDEDLNLRALRPLLSDLQTTGPEHLRPMLATLAQSDTRLSKQWGASGWVINGTLPKPAPDNDDLAAFTDEDDSASLVIRDKTRPVKLEDHCAGVTRFAVSFAERCGLPAELVRDFELAGRFHDAGKADPRFQDWLYRNSGLSLTPSPRPLIAKSTPTSPEIIQQTREASGYPKGARHELLSVHLLQHDDALKAQAHDWELVLHLIASHHGRCRPFAPVVDDPHPAEVTDTLLFGHPVRGQTRTDLERLDSGVADRFWWLTRKYGWWGLAYLEAIFRLADHRQSQLDAG